MSETKQILDLIIKDFSTEKFNLFFRRKTQGKFREINQSYQQYDDSAFKNGLKLGEAEFGDGKMLVCALKVQKSLSERSGKKAQYEKAKSILKSAENQVYSAGIFIFYDQRSSFRFSLVYPESMGTRRQWNHFKRFTYFVSQEFTNKTFLQRIGDGDFSTLAKIKEAFSVEPVNNLFFNGFREYFEKTKKEFEKSNKNTICLWLKDRYSDEEYKEQINRFAYTFLGRIIFIYFLQRKGWIENEPNFFRKNIENNENNLIYSSFFEPLFFEVFSKKEAERPPKIKEQYRDTPYLNGGLFERSELENQLAAKNFFILFDDKFIHNLILDFFENYNFTIDENSPDDQEVSIDPEMLGKVFENTLAEEERGNKGTFYTPREVVHFMVKDSLLQYLINETSFNKNKLHQFIFSEKQLDEIGFSKEEIRILDSELEEIKILDPAVGSAAFPVEMMQVLVNLRKQLNVSVGKNINEVTLKKKFIKENLYGVDIDSGAIEIAKLRLWLALIVDYEKSEAEPLPNLDFQFRLGNSLQEKIDNIDVFSEGVITQQGLFASESEFEKVKSKMIAIKDNFYISTNESEKRKLKKQFDDFEHQLIEKILNKYEKEFENQLKNKHFAKVAKNIKNSISKIENLKQKIKDGTYKLFKPDFHFSEVFDRKDENGKKIGGFDIVIGNPPYGVKIEDEIKKWHELGSKDSYGVFISSSLKRFLKPKGVLCFIVSDTWLTIKTHKHLREQVLEKDLHKIVRVHQDCFDATVNACIMLLSNQKTKNNKLLVADLTNISTRKEVKEFRGKLYNLEKNIGSSTPIFAVYEYPQELINTNTNLPIFVGSPKLFILMNRVNCQVIEKEVNKKKIKVRSIKINEKYINVSNFGATYKKKNNLKDWNNDGVVKIVSGIKTGDNKKYLKITTRVDKNFSVIDKDKILPEREWSKLSEDEKMNGINDDNKYFIPFEMGKSSDTDDGLLPNYYQEPTTIYINWSKKSVKQMKKEAHSDLANGEFRFKDGLSFSCTGYYAPTFRISVAPIFVNASSRIFFDLFNKNLILGVACSKLVKYLLKNYINHSVSFEVDNTKDFPFAICDDDEINNKIITKVSRIIERQNQNLCYDYMSNEQKEIDKLVYEMYGLNKDDIREVETWYARRYPKLARFCNIN